MNDGPLSQNRPLPDLIWDGQCKRDTGFRLRSSGIRSDNRKRFKFLISMSRLPESSHLIQQIVGVDGAARGRPGSRIFLSGGCVFLIAFFRGLGLFLLDLRLHLLQFQLQFLNLLRLRFRVVFAQTFVAQLLFNILQLLFQLAD